MISEPQFRKLEHRECSDGKDATHDVEKVHYTQQRWGIETQLSDERTLDLSVNGNGLSDSFLNLGDIFCPV